MSTFKPQPQRRAELAAALHGVALDDRDERMLDWMCGWDQATTDWLADLLGKACGVQPAAQGRR